MYVVPHRPHRKQPITPNEIKNKNRNLETNANKKYNSISKIKIVVSNKKRVIKTFLEKGKIIYNISIVCKSSTSTKMHLNDIYIVDYPI
jgi:hypothetical protein